MKIPYVAFISILFLMTTSCASFRADPNAGQHNAPKNALASPPPETLEKSVEKKGLTDPLEPWNVVWFYVNDKCHLWLLKPASKGYEYILPKVCRRGAYNLLDNLEAPRRALSALFQAKFKDSAGESGRFLVNSTVGCLGLWDPGEKLLGWEQKERDFDQTFATWGFAQGVYLVWPGIGPSSTRGSFGKLVDLALTPRTYIPGALFLERINTTSLGLNPYSTLRETAFDPYAAVRQAYESNRKKVLAE